MGLIALRIPLAYPDPVPEARLFRFCSSPRMPWQGCAASIALHATLLLAIHALVPFLPQPEVDLKSYTVQPISVLVPERPDRPAKAATVAVGAGAASGGGAHLYLPPDLELPRAASKPEIAAAILQPDADELTWFPETRARVIAWAKERAAERAAAALPIRPGRDGPAKQVTDINGQPKLYVPNHETTPADVNFAAAASSALARLPVPPSTTVPMRSMTSPFVTVPQPAAAIEETRGDAANLMLFSPEMEAQNQVVTVPAGSNLPGQSSGVGSGSATQIRTGAASSAQAARELAVSPSAASRARESPGDSNAALIAGSGESRATTASMETANHIDTSPSALPDARAVASSAPPAPAAGTRSASRAYDIMIVQSDLGSLDPAARLLTGKPIFTVYLDIGTRKAWLLYYCLPKETSANRTEATVVSLGYPQSLTAPYPVEIGFPVHLLRPSTGYELVHGILTTAGRFRDLRFAEDGLHQEVTIESIEKWTFHPALKGGTPVEVEILIAIPPTH